jgi:hypothetical protein
MDIAKVLTEKYDGTQWYLVANDYEQLTWDDTNTIPKPSLEELQQKWEEVKEERPMKILRRDRDFLLKNTDMYGLSDFKFKSEESKQAWLEYRQALRDITTTAQPELNEFDEVINVTWPTPPTS